MHRLVLVTSLTTAALFSAEARPDFSGDWKMDPARSVSANTGEPGAGDRSVIIKQTATEVSIETRYGDKSETLVYKLDGTQTEKPAQDNGPFQWRAEWDGGRLLTETNRNVNRATVTIKEARTLDPKGKEMTVDRTLIVQHGYSVKGGQNYATGKDVYVKAR